MNYAHKVSPDIVLALSKSYLIILDVTLYILGTWELTIACNRHITCRFGQSTHNYVHVHDNTST